MSMKISSFALALLAVATSPALVASEANPQQETNLQPVRAELEAPAPISGYNALKLLALETDVTARDVRLVLTTEARNERYDVRFERDMARRFAASLGPGRFSDLVAGLPIELHSPAVLDAARNMAAAAPNGSARNRQLDARVALVVLARP
jgi:hypothetical protein